MLKQIFSLLLIWVSFLFLSCKNEGKKLPEKEAINIKAEADGAMQKDQPEKARKGSESNPIVFCFTPSIDHKTIRKSSEDILSFLHNESGLNFVALIPDDYHAVIENIGSKKADLAIMNSFGYLLASEKYEVTAKLRALRYGKSTYRGQIIANKSSGIRNITDLNGKKFAFTDSSSTSGFLFPNQILMNKKVTPEKTFFAVGHDEVVKMVYSGKADGGATFYSEPSASGDIRDARARVKSEYPDVEKKVVILELTEPIPNDPVVFRKDIPTEILNKITFALLKYSLTDHGKEILLKLYGTEGFARCTDDDYALMHEIVKNNNIDLKDFL